MSSSSPIDGDLARRLRAAFEQTPVSTVVYDRTGKPLAVNPAFEKLWGATIDDVPADYSVLADPQLEAAGVMPELHRAFAGHEVTLAPLRYEMGQAVGRGRVVWTQAHLYPVRGPDGRVEQVVLTHQDITERRIAEEALSRALDRTDRLQALTAALSRASLPADVTRVVVEQASPALGATSVIIAIVSEDGEWLEIVDVGAIPGEVLEPWKRFPLTSGVPLAESVVGQRSIFLQNRATWLSHYPSMQDDLEKTGHHATMVLPLVVNDVPIGVMGIAFDTPQRFDGERRSLGLMISQLCAQALDRSRLLDAERRARREAESANRAKGDFLAVMSHELRTPLNAIGGYAELMELGVHGPLTDAQRNTLTRIQTSQRHLLGLINEVLNYAKLEAGTVQYDLRPVRVKRSLIAAEMLVSPQARVKQLELTVAECADDLEIFADEEKVQQILVNLLSNAVKFTDRGEILVEGTGGQDEARISVRDTGIGIPPEQLGRIFDPFVQVRSNLTRLAEGTGLGLAISRDLARAMKGDLVVESQPGVGSTFTLILPRPSGVTTRPAG
jgi:PAS domain S-box-containing protein